MARAAVRALPLLSPNFDVDLAPAAYVSRNEFEMAQKLRKMQERLAAASMSAAPAPAPAPAGAAQAAPRPSAQVGLSKKSHSLDRFFVH